MYSMLIDHGISSPVGYGSTAIHYSLSKAVSVLGLGHRCLKVVPTDHRSRIDLCALGVQLDECLEKQIPVFCVVAVLGTTEVGAIDDIEGLLNLREYYRLQGLDFNIHIDGAFGGYYLSCIRPDYPIENPFPLDNDGANSQEDVLTTMGTGSNDNVGDLDSTDPSDFCNDHLKRQLQACHRADSITIDPHKSGHCNYPAGSVVYRNSKFRDILANTAAYLGGKDSKEEPKVATYGIAGSSSGAAAVSVYFSHAVIRTSVNGYGRLLKRCLLNARLFYLRLLSISDQCSFKVITLSKPPSQLQLDTMFSKLVIRGDKWITPNEICRNKELLKEISEIGDDHAIVCYTFNFKKSNGEWNTDYNQHVNFNEAIYRRFHPSRAYQDLVIAETKINQDYGSILTDLVERVGICNKPAQSPMTVMRSTMMNPFVNELVNGASIFTTIFQLISEQVDIIASSFATIGFKDSILH
eukprot:gene10884-12681_t